ncbi:MAG: RAD55 family ATPase [Candidatus Bathyarchaeia archaeon]
MKIDRVPSGLPGFDELVGGGLPRGAVVLLSGGPGSGKTLFSLQFLYNGARQHGEPGVYLALAESPEHVRRDASALGWDLSPLEAKGKFALVDARPSRFVEGKGAEVEGVETFSSWIWTLISKNVERLKAHRLVIDSVNVVAGQFPEELQARQTITGLVQQLEKLPDCTSLLIFEQIKAERTMEEFLTHGVVILHYVPIKNGMMRAIQILKMRKTEHSENFHPFIIDSRGIRVEPKETSSFF